MDKTLFDFFVSVLRILEKEDYNSNSLENTIVSLIDSFDSTMSVEQKNIILKEFVKYEIMRKDREKDEKTKQRIDEMKYREVVDSALGKETGGREASA